MSRANKGRVAALRALIGVESGEHVEDLLEKYAPVGGADRGLSWHLALGTLRWQGALDSALQPFLRQPIERLDAGVRCALRMGLFEIHLSRTPTRAAVDQAVEVTKAVGLKRASGLVNAVLRKASATALPEDAKNQLPPWLFERWKDFDSWLKAIREPATISICGEPPAGIAVEKARLAGQHLKNAWTIQGKVGDIAQLDGFQQGKFWVMDPASVKVADLVIEAVSGDGAVLDGCSAPGGKSFRMAQHGLNVTACDVSRERLSLMEANRRRLGIEIEQICHDWTTGALPTRCKYDAVLVDAPCTGLGTVRRHPEIIWRRQAGDPSAMAVTQRRILRNASEHVKDGGALVYSVCSMEPEEGDQVVESLEGWQVERRWASAPPVGDEDGFQAFVLRRLES